MRIRVTVILMGMLLFMLPGEARTLKQEPPMGALKYGQRVLVDDGSCPAGQIKEVIGGNHVQAGGTGHIVRTRRCIRR